MEEAKLQHNPNFADLELEKNAEVDIHKNHNILKQIIALSESKLLTF